MLPTLLKFTRNTTLLVIVILGAVTSTSIRADISTGKSLITDKSLYRISISPQIDPIPIARLHSWVIHVETVDGSVFTPRQLVLTGGMPGHGHGLPSKPQVTKSLGNGDYLIGGMEFNMSGVWQLLVGVTGPDGPDQVTFEISILASPLNSSEDQINWSVEERQVLRSLWIENLAPVLPDKSNRFSGNRDAAELGEQLFFDAALSATGTVACATCHQAERKFTDGRKLSFGTAETTRNAPSLLGAVYHKWFYWDGRRDSLWSQAVTPIESMGEMDNNRVDAVRYVLTHDSYGRQLEKLGGNTVNTNDEVRFPAGAGPFSSPEDKNRWFAMRPEDRDALNRSFSDIGKIIAAYIERLRHSPSRFDAFVESIVNDGEKTNEKLLSHDEQLGLKLFLDSGRTQCLRCHNGPLFTNFGFHNIATGGFVGGIPDFGRAIGLQAALVDEFNCLGQYSDASKDQCTKIRYARSGHAAVGAFKVPTLRDIAETAPYLHDGRFDDLEEVVRFYTQAPEPELGPSELVPVDLSEQEIKQIVAFLKTLSGPQ